MERHESVRVGGYRVQVEERFGLEVARAEAGLELWRRFVRGAVAEVGGTDVAPEPLRDLQVGGFVRPNRKVDVQGH